jgi:hypothetical protein
MASVSQSKPVEENVELEDAYVLKPGHRLPGWTVDALLAEGKVDEARVELERLLQEGIDSGVSEEPVAEMMERLRARVRSRALAR